MLDNYLQLMLIIKIKSVPSVGQGKYEVWLSTRREREKVSVRDRNQRRRFISWFNKPKPFLSTWNTCHVFNSFLVLSPPPRHPPSLLYALPGSLMTY